MRARSTPRSKPWKRPASRSPRSSSNTRPTGSTPCSAAALMEPLVSRALEARCRKIADLRWRGGIVAGEDVDEETAGKLRRALNRAIEWLRQNEDRSRAELLRDLKPELRKDGLLPELTGVKPYQSAEFKAKVDWMLERGFLHEAPSYEQTVRTK